MANKTIWKGERSPVAGLEFRIGSRTGFTGGTGLGTKYYFPSGETAGSAFHTYGMIWSPGSVSYYVDSPSNVYATYTPSSLNGLSGAVWPFDRGQSNFIILNLAIGGSWPGSPDNTTPFPSQMLVDYVRIYTNYARSTEFVASLAIFAFA